VSTLARSESWRASGGALIRRDRTPRVSSRDSLVIGVDEPNATNTGLLPGTSLTTVSGSVTLSTPGQVFQNMDVFGRVSIAAADVTVKNCRIRGGSTVNASGIATCTNSAVRNALFEDCEIRPDLITWGWDCVSGHDYTLRRCNVWGGTDLVHVQNNGAPSGFDTGVVIEQCYLHDMRWWTAATAGVVHNSDTETHNDIIQHFGGNGTVIRGNSMHAAFMRQSGHWVVTNPNVEPYTTVALHSLADGGPFQNIPDRGTGVEANGRYNWDDDAILMINNTQGPSTGFTFDDNWCYGGNYAINGGGNANPGGGAFLGNFRRNKWDRTQGDPGTGGTPGGDTSHTINCGGTWGGFVNAPTTGPDANYYMDNLHPITVRT
jgi:hypothetical protein